MKTSLNVITIRLLMLAPVSLVSASCDLEEEKVEETPEDVLWRYKTAFLEEAARRGFDLQSELEALEFAFEERLIFDDEEFCGYVPVAASSAYTNRVLFATNQDCWTGQSEGDQEALVFHELGHALLDRGHRNDTLPHGSWTSLMVTKNTGSFYSGRIADRRTYYLDELFDASTPAPDWSK